MLQVDKMHLPFLFVASPHNYTSLLVILSISSGAEIGSFNVCIRKTGRVFKTDFTNVIFPPRDKNFAFHPDNRFLYLARRSSYVASLMNKTSTKLPPKIIRFGHTNCSAQLCSLLVKRIYGTFQNSPFAQTLSQIFPSITGPSQLAPL